MQKGNMTKEQKIRQEALEEMRFHFVFNALNAIRYMIRKNPDKAYSMVYDLSVFLRGNIDNCLSEQNVRLAEELKHVKAYIALEQVQNSGMELEWQCGAMEGYVEQGSIYRAAEQLVKQYIRQTKEKRTIIVQEDETFSTIRVWIAEEGEETMIKITVETEAKNQQLWEGQVDDENNIS